MLVRIHERFVDRFAGDPRGFVLRWLGSWARWSASLIILFTLYVVVGIVDDEFYQRLPRLPVSVSVLVVTALVVALVRESFHSLFMTERDLFVRKAGGSIRRYPLDEITVDCEQIQPRIHRVRIRSSMRLSDAVFYLSPLEANRLLAAVKAQATPADTCNGTFTET